MRNLFLLLFFVASTSLAQVKVIQLDAYAGKPAGNSLGAYVNHKTPANITAFTSNSIYNSTDSGKTWTASKLPDIKDAQQVQVEADPRGILYYFYTTSGNDEKIYFSKSTDDGKKWSEVSAIPSGKGKDSYISLSAHPKKDHLIFTFTQSEEVEGMGCVSNVYVAISSSGGKKWSDPVLINAASGDCSGRGKMVHAVSPLVGKDNKTFIVWAANEKIFIDRSYDGGGLWVRTDLPVAEQPGGWSLIVPDSGGMPSVPSVAVDNTELRTTGTLYLVYADQKNGATDTDIWLIRSPNHGDNWTYPQRVNLDEPGKYQYSPKISVDQSNGFVYTAWFDRRNYDDASSDIYMGWSSDAGGKFQEIKINDSPIAGGGTPALLAVAAHKGIVTVLWSATDNGQTIVRAALIRQMDLK
jgi:hypothetical protein